MNIRVKMSVKISRPRRIHITKDGYITKRSAYKGALPDAEGSYRGTGLPIYAVTIGYYPDSYVYEFRARSYKEAMWRVRYARRTNDAAVAEVRLRSLVAELNQ